MAAAGGSWDANEPRTTVMPEWVMTISKYSSTMPVAMRWSSPSPMSAAWALEQAVTRFAEVGITIERMLTDNGASYRSGAYYDVLAGHDIRHKRTRPYRPQTNGKAERFIQTCCPGRAVRRPSSSLL